MTSQNLHLLGDVERRAQQESPGRNPDVFHDCLVVDLEEEGFLIGCRERFVRRQQYRFLFGAGPRLFR